MDAHPEVQPMSERESFQFKESPTKRTTNSIPAPTAVTANGCFDCNICLDFAVDPVVTLCGHLYCWPCIYKWLELESNAPQQCPVCKATLSETALVPLYGRGKTTGDKECYVNGGLDIPRRPSIRRHGRMLAVEPEFSPTEPHRRRRYNQHYHHGRASRYDDSNYASHQRYGVPYLLGSALVAVLPSAFGQPVRAGLRYSDRYHLLSAASSPGERRQEIMARRSLHRIFVFLSCCTVLCLLLF